MKIDVTVVACIAAAVFTSPAWAGTYGDDLGKCLVAKSSDDDKIRLMQWIFGSMSAHPAVQSMSTVTPAQRTEYNRSFATLTGRLLFTDCRKEAVAALKYEGPSTFETSFSLLGQIAMRGLMSDPTVGAQMEQMGTMIDEKQLAALAKEAGLPPPPASKK